MNRKHRATGNPRGRPPTIPWNLSEKILQSLERRVDAATGLVRPNWKGLARELGVSRSTIARQMAGLRESGTIESVFVPRTPKVTDIFYRVKR